MRSLDRNKDTICAIATPSGVGGISVIRVSGPNSLFICKKLCSFLPDSPDSHKAFFGSLRESDSGLVIDEVVATFFQEGRSFTGEEVIEISCHGSPFICQSILNELINLGARIADRGEFTYRAFVNGRLDLVQAESVLDLIESQTKHSLQQALRGLKGLLSEKLTYIEDQMVWILAHAEASIDFSTEGIQVVEDSVVHDRLEKIEKSLSELVNSFKVGRLLADGLRIVLAGVPNVGKSSLLNLFIQDERAIVTDIPGTTRDVVSGDTSYNGFKFTFLDTAGLRDDVTDLVEQIGIRKSYEAQNDSDFVFFVFDCSVGISNKELGILDTLDPDRTFLVGNKIDKITNVLNQHESVKTLVKDSIFFSKIKNSDLFFKRRVFFVSALDKTARSKVFDEVVAEYSDLKLDNSVLLSNSRHYENLKAALENTRKSQKLVDLGVGAEFLALELKEALIAVQETLGKRFDDQIMDRVFKEFCIGK